MLISWEAQHHWHLVGTCPEGVVEDGASCPREQLAASGGTVPTLGQWCVLEDKTLPSDTRRAGPMQPLPRVVLGLSGGHSWLSMGAHWVLVLCGRKDETLNVYLK